MCHGVKALYYSVTSRCAKYLFSLLTGSQDVQLNVSSPAPTELLAAWTFENNETSYFEVMWSPPAEDDTSSATTNTTSYTITALTPCTPYIVSVRAVDFNNQTLGISSNETAITATPGTCRDSGGSGGSCGSV